MDMDCVGCGDPNFALTGLKDVYARLFRPNVSQMSASSSSASTALPSWSPQSWRSKPVGQPVDYGQDSAARLAGVTQRLAHLPPLVTNEEVSPGIRMSLKIAR